MVTDYLIFSFLLIFFYPELQIKKNTVWIIHLNKSRNVRLNYEHKKLLGINFYRLFALRIRRIFWLTKNEKMHLIKLGYDEENPGKDNSLPMEKCILLYSVVNYFSHSLFVRYLTQFRMILFCDTISSSL